MENQRKLQKPAVSLATLPTWVHWGQCAATEFGRSDHDVASMWSLDVVIYFGHGVIVPRDSNYTHLLNLTIGRQPCVKQFQ